MDSSEIKTALYQQNGKYTPLANINRALKKLKDAKKVQFKKISKKIESVTHKTQAIIYWI